jgi:hypothetical protein
MPLNIDIVGVNQFWQLRLKHWHHYQRQAKTIKDTVMEILELIPFVPKVPCKKQFFKNRSPKEEVGTKRVFLIYLHTSKENTDISSITDIYRYFFL